MITDARLQISDKTGRWIVPLDKPLLTIGRQSSCDLQLSSAFVSRDHAEIAHVDGHFRLRDRGSRFGTFVNNERITERVIAHGDCIRFGCDAELVFLGEPAEPSIMLREAIGDSTPDLRHMVAMLDGLRALGSGLLLDEVLTILIDLAIEVTDASREYWSQFEHAG